MNALLLFLYEYWPILAGLACLAIYSRRTGESFFEIGSNFTRWFITTVFGEKYTKTEGIFPGLAFVFMTAAAVMVFLITYPILQTEIAESLEHWHLTEHKEYVKFASEVSAFTIIVGMLIIERLAFEILMSSTGGRVFYLRPRTKSWRIFTFEKIGAFSFFCLSIIGLMTLTSISNGIREVAEDVTLKEVRHLELGTDATADILKDQLTEHKEAAAEYKGLMTAAQSKRELWEKRAPYSKDKQHAWAIALAAKKEAAGFRSRWQDEKKEIQKTQSALVARAAAIKIENKSALESFDTKVAAKQFYGRVTGIGADAAYLLLCVLHFLVGGGKLQPVVFETYDVKKEKLQQLEQQRKRKKATKSNNNSNRLAAKSENLLSKLLNFSGNNSNNSREKEQQAVAPVANKEQQPEDEKEQQEPQVTTTKARNHVAKRTAIYEKFSVAADGKYADHIYDICDWIEEPRGETKNAFATRIGKEIDTNKDTVRTFISRIETHIK